MDNFSSTTSYISTQNNLPPTENGANKGNKITSLVDLKTSLLVKFIKDAMKDTFRPALAVIHNIKDIKILFSKTERKELKSKVKLTAAIALRTVGALSQVSGRVAIVAGPILQIVGLATVNPVLIDCSMPILLGGFAAELIGREITIIGDNLSSNAKGQPSPYLKDTLIDALVLAPIRFIKRKIQA